MTGSNGYGRIVPPSRRVADQYGRRNGNGFDARLKNLEIQVIRIDERLTGIQENLVKKDDISKLEIWILSGILGAIVVSIGITTTVIKAFAWS